MDDMKKKYGNISVDTKHGRGTEMRVSLPDLYAEGTAK
jgi:chemotaxis protein histidine kinase CheA